MTDQLAAWLAVARNHRAAGYVTRSHGGVGGGRDEMCFSRWHETADAAAGSNSERLVAVIVNGVRYDACQVIARIGPMESAAGLGKLVPVSGDGGAGICYRSRQDGWPRIVALKPAGGSLVERVPSKSGSADCKGTTRFVERR